MLRTAQSLPLKGLLGRVRRPAQKRVRLAAAIALRATLRRLPGPRPRIELLLSWSIRTEAGDEEIEIQEDGPKEPDPEYVSIAYLPVEP